MLAAKQEVGKLDRRLTIQRKIVGENESNEDEEVGWEDIDVVPMVWGSIDDRSGNEHYSGDRLTAYENSTIIIRYRADVTPENRILSGGKIYDIQSVSEVGRKRFLQLTVETGGNYQES